MNKFYDTINGFDPDLKDTINSLTLEALNDSELKEYIEYMHENLFYILGVYYPSFDLKRNARFDLHPMYFKYIADILNDKTHIDNIAQNIKTFFKENPEGTGKIEIFVEKYGLKFGISPACSVSSMGCDGKIYGFHNLDSARQQGIFEKVFKIYITYVYNTILKIIKGEIQSSSHQLGYIPAITIKLNGND